MNTRGLGFLTRCSELGISPSVLVKKAFDKDKYFGRNSWLWDAAGAPASIVGGPVLGAVRAEKGKRVKGAIIGGAGAMGGSMVGAIPFGILRLLSSKLKVSPAVLNNVFKGGAMLGGAVGSHAATVPGDPVGSTLAGPINSYGGNALGAMGGVLGAIGLNRAGMIPGATIPMDGLTKAEFEKMVAEARTMGSKIRPHRVGITDFGGNFGRRFDKYAPAGTHGVTAMGPGDISPLLGLPEGMQAYKGSHRESVEQLTKSLAPNEAIFKRRGIDINTPAGKERALKMLRRAGLLPKLLLRRDSAAGVVAHELGHSTGSGAAIKDLSTRGRNILAGLKGGYSLGPGAAVLASAISGATGDDSVAIPANIAASAATAPMVAEELRASIRGAKLLKSIGKNRAGAFIGLPSYLGIAAAPWAVYGARKLITRKPDTEDNPV